MSEPRNTRRHDFRIIRGAGGNYKVQYYATREQRDEAAQKFADQDGTNVVTELWAVDNSQDDLNQGWGCDGHRSPTQVHRYTDCANVRPGDQAHESDDDDRPVTCPTCREYMGLPNDNQED